MAMTLEKEQQIKALRSSVGVFTEEELAMTLGVKVGTIKDWRRLKWGPKYKTVGHQTYYHATEVIRWLLTPQEKT